MQVATPRVRLIGLSAVALSIFMAVFLQQHGEAATSVPPIPSPQLILGLSGSDAPQFVPPTLNSSQKSLAVESLAEVSDSGLLNLLSRRSGVSQMLPVTDSGSGKLVSIEMVVDFAQPQTFRGFLPGGSVDPSRTPQQIDRMTQLFVRYDLSTGRIVDAIPGPDSVIVPSPTVFPIQKGVHYGD